MMKGRVGSRETENKLTHTDTDRRVTSMRSMEKDEPGVKGQDHLYCNKHISTLCNGKKLNLKLEPVVPIGDGKKALDVLFKAKILALL